MNILYLTDEQLDDLHTVLSDYRVDRDEKWVQDLYKHVTMIHLNVTEDEYNRMQNRKVRL